MEHITKKFLHTTYGTEAFYRKGAKLEKFLGVQSPEEKVNTETILYINFK